MEQEYDDESGKSRLAVKFDLVKESHSELMKTVDVAISHLTQFKGSEAALMATTTGATLGTVLQAIVPVINQSAAVGSSNFYRGALMENLQQAHPMLTGAWIVLSSAYKVRYF